MRITSLIIVLVFSSCVTRRIEKQGVYTEVSPTTFLEQLEDTSVYLLDVRTIKEYSKSHIENAINVSYFSGNFSKQIEVLSLDTSKTVMIYCETQHRSLFAAKVLYRKGFRNIIDLDKGMMNWRKLDYPFEQDSCAFE